MAMYFSDIFNHYEKEFGAKEQLIGKHHCAHTFVSKQQTRIILYFYCLFHLRFIKQKPSKVYLDFFIAFMHDFLFPFEVAVW